MHYLSVSQHFVKSTLLIFALLTGLTISAQNTAPKTTPNLPTEKVDPATISNQQAIDFYNQAKSAGMTDMDIERAAMQKGYTLDDISAMRKRVEQGAKPTSQDNANRDKLDESRTQPEKEINETDTKEDLGQTTSASDKTFGSSFFRQKSTTFEPNLRLATPKNYILGPEDELVVDIYGNSVDNFRLKISPEGTVKMLNLAPVYVNGLTVEQAKDRIVTRLRQAYSNLDRPGSGTYATITLGGIRSIHVMITGEVVRPGTYTVPSLATAFNAIYQSGGPSTNGSYRNIEIIRNNNVIRKIDLYNFLVNADLKDNIALQDQDIILIRPYEKRIEMNGQFKKTGIFEAKGTETIKDLINYAGGYLPDAYNSIINYQRNTGSNYVIGSIDSAAIASFIPQNGDIFRIDKILDMVANQVQVAGAVARPGVYAIEDRCNTLLELISLSQGLSQRAFLNRATIERSSGTMESIFIAVDLEKLINKQIDDVPLMPGDIVTIKSVDDLKESPYITISGSVNYPSQQYYYKDITIADAIFKAGGYKEEGIPYRIEVSRRIKNDTTGIPADQNVQIFTLNVQDDLKLNSEDQKFRLRPYDIVTIRKSPRYETQKLVTVLGEVNYPGTYTILTNFERISDLFPKTGGLKNSAYLEGARFYRNGELVAVDLNKIIETPSIPANLLIRSRDTLYVPIKPEVVRIQGAVQNPSLINFDKNFSFRDYISQAGGYGESAWKNHIYVSHLNGRTFRTKKFLFFKSYPSVEPGSIITIPFKQEKPDRQTSPGERIALISLMTTLSLGVISLFR